MSASDLSDSARRRRPRPEAGLSLVEVLVATTLLGILATAVMSSFIFLLRGEKSIAHYTEMNSDSRQLLELLSRDAKSASAVTNFTKNSLSLIVPQDTSGATAEITYEYIPSSRTIIRETSSSTTTLVTNVDSFSFRYLNSNNLVTTSLTELKQVQLSLRIVRSVVSISTSQYVISAQYTLRAKPTAH